MIRNFGMDYGVKPRMMLVSDLDFQFKLQNARFSGFIYLFCKDANGEQVPSEIGFRFEDSEQASDFFDSLISWQENSGGDSKAVSLEFIELNNGDYKIVVSPDMDMFIDRMIPFHLRAHIDPIAMMASRSLTLIDQSGNFKDFKNSYIEGRRIIVRYFIPDGDGLMASDKYFVKKEFAFYREDEIPKDIQAYFNLKATKKDFLRSKHPKIAADNPQLSQEREECLNYFFPVTVDKLVGEEWLAEIISTINKIYSAAQVRQAICNLVLLERIKKVDDHQIDINKIGYDKEIITYLAETFESFDSDFPTDAYFTKQVIEKQIRLDAKFLKQRLEKP